MCGHGVNGHTIQIVEHLEAGEYDGTEFRCAVCTNRFPFLLVSSPTRSSKIQDFLLAQGVNVVVMKA